MATTKKQEQQQPFRIIKKLHKYDGYQAPCVFYGFKSSKFPYDFCFYDYLMDSQGSIPLRNTEEWKKKFNI